MKLKFALVIVVCLAFPASASALKPQLLTVPPEITNSQTQTFEFTIAAAISYQCSLDGAALTACVSPQSYSGLAEGTHTFTVIAQYNAPQPDFCIVIPPSVTPTCFPMPPIPTTSEASVFEFMVDRTGPTIEFAGTTKQGSASRARTANIQFQMERGGSYLCTFDKRTPEPCESPIDWRNLEIGLHRVKIQATDAAGNVGSVFSLEFAVNSRRITYRSITKTTAKRCVKKKVRRGGKLRNRTKCKKVRF